MYTHIYVCIYTHTYRYKEIQYKEFSYMMMGTGYSSPKSIDRVATMKEGQAGTLRHGLIACPICKFLFSHHTLDYLCLLYHWK